MAASGFINCLVIVIIINTCTGELGSLNELIGTDTVSKHQRYKCHSCEPPDCSTLTVCNGAIQCWKSRIRESSTGEERVARGCASTEDQLPLICRTPSFAVQQKRRTVGKLQVRCCVGDFCNDGDFPELPPLVREEISSRSFIRSILTVLYKYFNRSN